MLKLVFLIPLLVGKGHMSALKMSICEDLLPHSARRPHQLDKECSTIKDCETEVNF